VLWGTRVVVPAAGRKGVLAELHEGHPGIARMKSLARMYVWWPGISEDIQNTVQGCLECQENQKTPPLAPLHPWSWPTRPWARLHLDYAGPVRGQMFLVLIDAHSKWIEAFCTPTSTSEAVIRELRTVFARFGLPETVVTDNGTCFVSAEFETFLRKNGIKHFTSAPYHPASNGMAERAVQILKMGLKKITKGSISERLAKILMSYRLTPQTTTGISPAELLLGKRPRSRLDLLKPHTAERVELQQQKQKAQHDARAQVRQFGVGEQVFVRNYQAGKQWLPGVIERTTGPVSFLVKLDDGRQRRCHQDQVRKCTVAVPPSTVQSDADILEDIVVPSIPNETSQTPPPSSGEQSDSQTSSAPTSLESDPSVATTHVKTYPKRNRVPRTWFDKLDCTV